MVVRPKPLKVHCGRIPRLSRVMFLPIVASLVCWGTLPTVGLSKELPMPVTVRDLAAEPARYDGHRVVVTGRVRSMEMQVGRRGSEYVMLVLEDDSPASSGAIQPIQVLSSTIPNVRQGDHALFKGSITGKGSRPAAPLSTSWTPRRFSGSSPFLSRTYRMFRSLG